jgi:hypothetical protein
LNRRYLPPLNEVVNCGDRNPQILGSLFYGKKIMTGSFTHG